MFHSVLVVDVIFAFSNYTAHTWQCHLPATPNNGVAVHAPGVTAVPCQQRKHNAFLWVFFEESRVMILGVKSRSTSKFIDLQGNPACVCSEGREHAYAAVWYILFRLPTQPTQLTNAEDSSSQSKWLSCAERIYILSLMFKIYKGISWYFMVFQNYCGFDWQLKTIYALFIGSATFPRSAKMPWCHRGGLDASTPCHMVLRNSVLQ